MYKINDCAKHFGISRATLYRHYEKFIRFGGRPDYSEHIRTCGGNPILTRVEEQVMTKTVLDLRAQGFTVTSSDIKRICFEYCDSNGIPTQFRPEKRMASDDWYYGFLKRHPEMRISKPGCANEDSCEVDGGGDDDKKKGISKVWKEKGSGASLLKSQDPPLKSKASKKPSGELKKPVKRLKKNTNASNPSQSEGLNTFSKSESLQDVDTVEELMESGKGTAVMDIEEPKKEISEKEEDSCEEISENGVDSDDMEVSESESSETEQSESDEGEQEEEEDEDYEEEEEDQTQKVDEGEEADNFEDIEQAVVTQELDENVAEDAMDTDDAEIPKLEAEEDDDDEDEDDSEVIAETQVSVDDDDDDDSDDCVEEEEEIINNECEEDMDAEESEGDEGDDEYSAEEEVEEEEEDEE